MRQIPLFKVHMNPSAGPTVSEVLASGYVGQGPKVEAFEAGLRSHFRNDNVLTVNSCTSALQLAVHLLNEPGQKFGPDDEVLCTPLTCFATCSAIIASGCKVRWADVDPETGNVDLDDVERKVGPNTRAVMVVHWGGYPVDLHRLGDIQSKYWRAYGKRLPVIEDCAHVWDSSVRGYKVGSPGNMCAFSFQAIKFLTTGDGGLLTLPNDRDLYRRAKNLRWFGLDRDSGQNFRCSQDIAESGFKYHLNDLAAAIGLTNLPDMGRLVARHKENAAYYSDRLAGVPGLGLMRADPGFESSSWLYTIRVDRRDQFVKALEARGIAANQVHARCDKHSCVKRFRSLLPGMDRLEPDMVCIPVGWWVTDEDREFVVETIKKGW